LLNKNFILCDFANVLSKEHLPLIDLTITMLMNYLNLRKKMKNHTIKVISSVFLGAMISSSAIAGVNSHTVGGVTYIADSSVIFPDDTVNFEELCPKLDTDGVEVGDAMPIDAEGTVMDITACLEPVSVDESCDAEVSLGKGSLTIPCLKVRVNDDDESSLACEVHMGQRGNSMNWKVEFVDCEPETQSEDLTDDDTEDDNSGENDDGEN